MVETARRIYVFDKFQVDAQKRLLWRDGEAVPLTSKAFDLLLALLENSGREMAKDELMQRVWADQSVEDGNLTVTMSFLRRALGEKANDHRFIVTIPGRGYRFVAEVSDLDAAREIMIESKTASQVTIEEETVSEIEKKFIGRAPPHAIAPVRGDEKADLAVPNVTALARPEKSRSWLEGSRRLLTALALSLLIGVVAIGVLWSIRSRRGAPLAQLTVHRFTTQSGVPYRVAISPDGKSLVYIQRLNGKDSAWLGQVETNSSVELSQLAGLWLDNFVFTPDSSNIYFMESREHRGEGTLARMPVIGGVMTEMIPNVSGPVTFSPDGRQFAFLRREEGTGRISLVIADSADGHTERTLSTRKAPEGFSNNRVSWSPDGRAIAFGADKANGQDEILAVSVADGTVKKIGKRDWSVVDNVLWLPDGSGLLLMARENIGERLRQIWLVTYPEGEARKITNDLNTFVQSDLSVSAGGKLAVVQGHIAAEIWIAPGGDQRQARRVLQGVAPRYEGVDGLAFAPDGRVFYTAYVGDSEVIWSMNSDGGDQRQLTPTRSNISDSEITVTRDGRYVVFQSNRSGNMEIWRVDIDGANLKQLTSGGANTQPSLSPDGQSIIYTSAPAGQPALWRISIAGGEAMRLTSESSSLAQVSPDGKCIAYLAHASSSHLRLMVMPFAGGEPLKSFDVPGNALRGRQRMRWTPDGTAIMYKGDDMDQGLWQQSLDQEKPQPLKGFETLLVRHLAWSFDGKSLAYTSGPNTQEIVLIENFK